MEKIDLFLSDEFITFSKNIETVHLERKTCKEKFQALYEAYKAEMKVIDAKAQSIVDQHEQWKSTQKVAKSE